MKKALISGMILSTLLVAPAIASAATMSTGDDLFAVLDNLTIVLFNILIAVAIIFIIIAAFFFVTAQGDAEKVKTARNFVLYALIGVAVAVLAKVLVNWVDRIA
ncbi:hypothetical protein KKA24_01475 [Patescibacteria group bacterium]|nr:hypothetical protein [Patescibacteria group bacterium]